MICLSRVCLLLGQSAAPFRQNELTKWFSEQEANSLKSNSQTSAQSLEKNFAMEKKTEPGGAMILQKPLMVKRSPAKILKARRSSLVLIKLAWETYFFESLN